MSSKGGRWIYNSRLGVMGMPADEYYAKYGGTTTRAPYVMGDVQPYKSIVTGETINGRRQHREHLKQHGLVEVGNERIGEKPKRKPLPPVHEDIKAATEMVRSGYRPGNAPTFNPNEFE